MQMDFFLLGNLFENWDWDNGVGVVILVNEALIKNYPTTGLPHEKINEHIFLFVHPIIIDIFSINGSYNLNKSRSSTVIINSNVKITIIQHLR